MRKHSVRKAVILAGALCFASFVSPVQAVIVLPGTAVPAVPAAGPIGGVQLGQVIAPFSSGVLAGTLTSTVISGDTSNPFHGLTFTYRFTVDSAAVDSASQISISSFLGFTTDMSFNPQFAG